MAAYQLPETLGFGPQLLTFNTSLRFVLQILGNGDAVELHCN
jgi:hypothetical protein